MSLSSKPTYQMLENLIEQLKSEVKRNQSKNRINLLLKASEDIITLHKPNGEYLYYNGPKCYSIIAEDIVGKMPKDLFNLKVSNALSNAFDKVSETGESITIEVLLNLTSKERWYSEYIYPIKDDKGKVIEMVKICRDIHAQKLNEQEIKQQNKALLESEKSYRDVLEASSDLIVVMNAKGAILFINHASKKFYGLESKACLGKQIFDFVHSEDQIMTKEKFLEWSIVKDTNFHFENRQKNILGEVCDTEWNVNIARAGKKIIKITAIIRDITKQNITHQELINVNKELQLQNKLKEYQTEDLLESKKLIEESEERFRLLMQHMDAGIVVHGPDTSILINNFRASEILGLTNAQIQERDVNDPHWKFLRQDASILPLSEYPANKIATSKKPIKNKIYGIFHPDTNNIVWAKVSGYASLNKAKEINEIVISFIDITEQRKIEEEKLSAILKLERSEKRLNHTQVLAKVGSWVFEPFSQIISWSDETYHLWGFDPKIAPPAYDILLKRVHKKDLELFQNTYNDAINYGTPYDVEIRLNLPNDVQKTLRSICKPVMGPTGEVFRLMGANVDITAQKMFEKEKVKHQRVKAIGEMSSSIAHDFNNSLQQMSGNLEVIRLQKDLPEAVVIRLKSISSIIGDAAGRVNALQKFGDSENDNKNIENINFNTLIEDSLNQSRPLWKDDMERKGLCFEIKTNFKEIPNIKVNAGELKSAIHNLIKNSIEAMPQGGAITIATGLRNNGIFATFADTGIGMDQKTKMKVFEPFFSTKGFKLGRGLGMSGVYNTIKKYDGDIHIKSSKPGAGTTFEIVFPSITPEESIQALNLESSTKEVFKVLWVDDDAMITEDISELLELMGHTCSIANSGEKALAYLKENSCDIVFTDIGMPGMNGWQLIDTIRENFSNNIKIITVSGWSIDDKAKIEHRIDSVLQKPFTVEKLEKLFLKI